MGKLVVYTGPMKSGKTTALLNEYNNAKFTTNNSDRIVLFKPVIDDRFSEHNVVTRDGKMLPCKNVDTINCILKQKDTFDKCFIDEFQFLAGDVSKLIDLAMNDKEFYIAGLNLTAERRPFGLMNRLFPYATEIKVLSGNCDVCKKEKSGIFTYYDGEKHDDILVGEDNYLCVCGDCYNKLARRTK